MQLQCGTVGILAVVAVALAGCGGSGGGTSSSAAAPPAAASSAAKVSSTPAKAPSASGGAPKVAIKDFDYAPKKLEVKAGTKVSWTNQDAANHTVTFDTGGKDLGDQPKGKTVTFTFKKPGTYKYHCDYHPNMHGTVVVG